MNDLRRKSPKEFWKIFKSRKQSAAGDDISNEEF